MKLLVFVTPTEFRDETLSMMKLFFDKWGIEYKITSYSHRENCTGTHGAVCKIDLHANNVNTEDYNGIVLIDGKGIEAYRVYEHRPLLDLMLKFNDKKKTIIAVSNSVKVPARANIIKNRKISVPDDQETKRLIQLFHGLPSTQNFEISENLITIRDSSDIESSMREILEYLGVT